MAPPTRPRSTSANPNHVHQDVTVTSSTRAEIGIDEPSNSEFVSIETSGLNRSNTHNSNGSSHPKLLRRWITSRRGSMSVAHSMHNEYFPDQTSRDLQAIKDQNDGSETLADFLMEVPPPPTNHMADVTDDETKKPRSLKSLLFGIFGRKKKNKGGLIQLPDTAVAATTTSGARYVAISIPDTLPEKRRSRPNTSSKHVKTTVSVLESVVEASGRSPRNNFVPRYNNRGIENRAEERSSLVSEPALGGGEMRTMQKFYRQQRQSMVNDTPSPIRPLSITKNGQSGRPRSTRYSIFPPVSHSSRNSSLQHSEFKEVSDPVTTSSGAQRQSVRPKSGPATSSAHYHPQIQIPPRRSSLFKVPLPRVNPQEMERRLLVDEDMEENTEAQDWMPELEMLSAPGSASTFGANQRQSMAEQLERSLPESNPKRTISGSTFGTPSRQENPEILQVAQTESNRPFTSPPTDILAARNRAFNRLSSMSTSPSVSYQNRRQLVNARKARDISIYKYNQQKFPQQSISRISDIESSNTDEDDLATITSAGRTAQVNRGRASSIPTMPLCEQLAFDFSGPNHRGNETDLFYDAQTSIPSPSPMVSISDFPAVTNTATSSSIALATHKAPIRRAISDATTPPPSSSDSESFPRNARYSYQVPDDSEARYQVTRSPTALMDHRQERRVMRRVSIDEHRTRELEFRLSRLENDNLILRSALLGISESVQGMREFILGEEM